MNGTDEPDRALQQRGSSWHSAPNREGELLSDKYRVVRLLGEGGMGAVYEARHSFVGRRFAIKFLHGELAENNEVLARFQREAQAAGALENENIVAVTDFGYAPDGAPYIVMEHLEGEDLRGLLNRKSRLRHERAVNIIIQSCRGLHAAHARDIIHRDLKPENVFIARRNDGADLVKILDFGIAKLQNVTTAGVSTRTGVVIGTLHYMPPEQIRGDKCVDHRSDIYALGAILYESISGRVPHPGEAAHNVVYHVLHEPVYPLITLRPDVPVRLCEEIHRALSNDPADRHQTVEELAQSLAPFAGRQITAFDSLSPPPLGVTPEPATPAGLSPVKIDRASTAPFSESELQQMDRPALETAATELALPNAAVPAPPTTTRPDAPSSGFTNPAYTDPALTHPEILIYGKSRGRLIAVSGVIAVAMGVISLVAVFMMKDGSSAASSDTTKPPNTVAPSETPARSGPVGKPPAAPDEPSAADELPTGVEPPSVPEPTATTKPGNKDELRPKGDIRRPLPPKRPAKPEPPKTPSAAKKLIEQATAAYRARNNGKAYSYFKRATRVAPKNATAWRGLGRAAARLSKKPEAVNAFKRYLELSPNAADAGRVRQKIKSLR